MAICVMKSIYRPCRYATRVENLSSKSRFNFRIVALKKKKKSVPSDRLSWKQHAAGLERRLGTRSHMKLQCLRLWEVDSDGESGKETLKIADCPEENVGLDNRLEIVDVDAHAFSRSPILVSQQKVVVSPSAN